MDTTLLSNLINGGFTVLAAIIAGFLPWWLTRVYQPEAIRKKLKKWFSIIVAGILGVLTAASIILYWWLNLYSRVTPNFSPALMEEVQSNATNAHYIAEHPGIPSQLNWYGLINGDFVPTQAAQIEYPQIDHYLYYESTLHTKEYSWTGFLFWRKFPLPCFDLRGKSELLIILEAEHPDVLEIGLKDVHGNEKKITLATVSGWAGYRIPLKDFPFIDSNKTILFLLAHTRGIGSRDSNLFRIAYIGAI